MTIRSRLLPVLALLLLVAPPAAVGPATAQAAKEFSIGKLKIIEPWSRATPRSAPVAGGYLKITNTGAEADRLISGTATISGRFTIHEMRMDGGVMKMRPLIAGLEIKPGESVELKPGGYHLMFEDLKGGLTEGQRFKAELTFETAGKVEVEFSVMSIGATAPGATMNEHQGGHQH